ncbi:MAG: ATP synthase F1 subunit delta [Chloroflexi bacterium HGW-Chloroflexi-1]|nr:MAG: ATP synthase F1 subunit delta [Chloroflexi bacterium HGW-Chloroflexi-1]
MNTQDRVRSYADAFFEAAWERWLAALETAAGRLEQNPQLLARLQAADVEFAQRQPLLDSILSADVDQPVRNLLYTLMQRGELALLAGIAHSLRQRARAQAAPVRVEVISAVPLTDTERQALLAQLEAQHGAGLDVRHRVDPTILGGLIVRVGDKLIDGSLASRLAAMRQALGATTGD